MSYLIARFRVGNYKITIRSIGKTIQITIEYKPP
jgi:hypothetical protein